MRIGADVLLWWAVDLATVGASYGSHVVNINSKSPARKRVREARNNANEARLGRERQNVDDAASFLVEVGRLAPSTTESADVSSRYAQRGSAAVTNTARPARQRCRQVVAGAGQAAAAGWGGRRPPGTACRQWAAPWITPSPPTAGTGPPLTGAGQAAAAGGEGMDGASRKPSGRASTICRPARSTITCANPSRRT